MAENLSFKKITSKDFDACLNRYEDIVPDSLRELDEFRFVTLPAEVRKRRDAKEGAWLTKEEVRKLVDWKLKHGTFRPSLQKLVASNSEEDVLSITTTAFDAKEKPLNDMVKELAKLRGIGPATAALLASCYQPDNAPFFSDEMFRWLHWDGKTQTMDGINTDLKKPGRGWSRQIGYTMKEYESLCVKCESLQNRLNEQRHYDCFAVEKVAYVLGREKTDVGTNGVGNEETNTKTVIKHKSSQASAMGRKRKASVHDPPETKTRITRARRGN